MGMKNSMYLKRRKSFREI